MAAPESLSDRPCIVLSSHLGDAALSCGYLMSQLSASTPVTVMTVFTHSQGNPTRTARAYLEKRNARKAPALYNQRRTEDLIALRSIGVTGVHFGFADALFRRRPDNRLPKIANDLVPELSVIYPTYRWHIAQGKVSPLDEKLLSDLEQRLLFTTGEDDVILAPIGLSNHVDRVLVHELGLRMAKHRTVGFYAEQPDAQKLEGDVPAPKGTELVKFDVDLHAKAQLLERFTTHTRAILGRRVPALDEYVFMPTAG
ncbi:hypothetical protein [Kineosporia sp. NBRC 101731]|uniref:hypothetical protein n=1 Tax=Kineosporia sp. NBRC 101731 TaxID=3032199 RepID=UPI0024A501B6|nr:hypothetical protein [Kineosporia sp. NBRC 101731]GLY28351.1 hypothetical protein Kisp02_17160 [Kineosporia sp. NBRC 101731]